MLLYDFRGFSSSRSGFDTAPHIDTWTNEKTVNGDNDLSIGGLHLIGSARIELNVAGLKKILCLLMFSSLHSQVLA